MKHYQVIRKNSNHGLAIEGILITMDSPNTIVSAQVRALIEQGFAGMVPIFKTHIPRSIKVAEAVLYHKTICEYMPNNPAAIAMGSLWRNFWRQREAEKRKECVRLARPKINLADFDAMLNFDSKEEAVPAPQGHIPGTELVHNGILEMDFSQMEPFPEHKFKLYEGQQLNDMVESIRQFGILLPIILWHTGEGKYIILSGHNRRNAAMLAGLTKGPVIIRENLTHDEATLIVTETNLRQRSFADMSHSERAYCLAQHYEALKSQGRRNDLLTEIEMLLNPHESRENSTSSEVQTKLRADEKIGQEYDLSRDKVAKYIRISKLVPPLIERVDTAEIAFLAAYDLSFVEDTEKQQQIADLMVSDGYKLDMKKAELLRNYYETGKLTDITMTQILSGEKTRKPKSDKPQPIKVKPEVITKYFTAGQSVKEIEETIDRALELYFGNQNGKMDFPEKTGEE